MRTSARWSIVLAWGFAATPGVAPAAPQEQIGSWVLRCPGDLPKSEPCLMRSNKRFLEKAGITGDPEVRAQGGILVPVIAPRGFSSEMPVAVSLAGKKQAMATQRSLPLQR